MNRNRLVFTGLFIVFVFFTAFVVKYNKEIFWFGRYLNFDYENIEDNNWPNQLKSLNCSDCNVILISLDTVQAQALNPTDPAYVYTPNIQKIRNQSIVFNRAYTNSYYTTPSHMTAFTCTYPMTHNMSASHVFWTSHRENFKNSKETQLSEKYLTMAELLKKNKYSTYWFAPTESNYFPLKSGFERGFDQIWPPLTPRPFFEKLFYDKEKSFKPFIESLKNPGKKFYFLHSYTAHLPYLNFIPEHNQFIKAHRLPLTEEQLLKDFLHYYRLFGDSYIEPSIVEKANYKQDIEKCFFENTLKECTEKIIPYDVYVHTYSRTQAYSMKNAYIDPTFGVKGKMRSQRILLDSYADSIKILDDYIGEIWKQLEKNDLLKNSIVVLFSDHGLSLMEHKVFGPLTFHEETTNVTFSIYHPEIKKAVATDISVSLVDMLPMIFNLVGIEKPEQCEGPFARNKVPLLDRFGFTLGDEFYESEGWKYLRSIERGEELYYLPLDPNERRNLLLFDNPFIHYKKKKIIEGRDKFIDRVYSKDH